MDTITAIAQQLFASNAEWTISSIPFFALFVIFMLIYILIVRQKRQWSTVYVLLFSIFFAAKANGWLMLILVATTLISWYGTKIIAQQPNKKHKTIATASLVFIELLPLLYYKYALFGTAIISAIFQSNFALQDIILPVGISFYTFQAISYTLDVAKGKFHATTSLLDYSFYLTFFPLITAGPITRPHQLIPQIGNPQHTNAHLINKGLWLILCGIAKKLILADYIAQFNNMVFADPMAYSGFENLMAVFGFTLQIYCDFAGYSDMAIGMAALMGYELPNNFRFPYHSTNLTAFWHRWHISLSTWFRDYIYIPLGGNRKGILRTYIHLLITMLVAGLWHGASPMFLLWGLLHGIGLIVHKYYAKQEFTRTIDSLFTKICYWLITFLYIAAAWVFFRADNLSVACNIFQQIAQNLYLADAYTFLMARPQWLIMLVVGLELHSIKANDYQWLSENFAKAPWVVKLIIFLIIVQCAIHISQESVQPFIYTRF